MVEDICFHLVDLVQNSVAAGSTTIQLHITESEKRNTLTIEIVDNGRGMDEQTVEKVQDPFFTSKGFKKVGLGIPLLKATAQACRGGFAIRSEAGSGTVVEARMERGHPDCPPLGNLPDTLLSLLVSLDGIDLQFAYDSDRGEFTISSADVRRQVDDMHFSHPDVYRFLKEYIHEGLRQLLLPMT